MELCFAAMPQHIVLFNSPPCIIHGYFICQQICKPYLPWDLPSLESMYYYQCHFRSVWFIRITLKPIKMHKSRDNVVIQAINENFAYIFAYCSCTFSQRKCHVNVMKFFTTLLYSMFQHSCESIMEVFHTILLLFCFCTVDTLLKRLKRPKTK